MLNLGLTKCTPNEKHIYTQLTMDTVVKWPIISLNTRTGNMEELVASAFLLSALNNFFPPFSLFVPSLTNLTSLGN